jgi:hypothetical protein
MESNLFSKFLLTTFISPMLNYTSLSYLHDVLNEEQSKLASQIGPVICSGHFYSVITL